MYDIQANSAAIEWLVDKPEVEVIVPEIAKWIVQVVNSTQCYLLLTSRLVANGEDDDDDFGPSPVCMHFLPVCEWTEWVMNIITFIIPITSSHSKPIIIITILTISITYMLSKYFPVSPESPFGVLRIGIVKKRPKFFNLFSHDQDKIEERNVIHQMIHNSEISTVTVFRL